MVKRAGEIVDAFDPAVVSVFSTKNQTSDECVLTSFLLSDCAPPCSFLPGVKSVGPRHVEVDSPLNRRRRYFLSSASKVHCFFEEKAFAPDGSLAVPKSKSINKIGTRSRPHLPLLSWTM